MAVGLNMLEKDSHMKHNYMHISYYQQQNNEYTIHTESISNDYYLILNEFLH